MTTTELVEALSTGAKVRRPDWPAGEYVEAEGTGSARKVAQATMLYCREDRTLLWASMPTYDQDFTSEDFELLS